MIWTFLQKLLKGVCSWETLQWGTLKDELRRYCAAGQFEPEAPLESIEASDDTPIMEEYLERLQSPERANSWTSGGSLADERCWFPHTC